MARILSRRIVGWSAAVLLVAVAKPSAGQVGGVAIDSRGVLKRFSQLTADERLELLKQHAAAPASTQELAAASSLRKVSLRRLEEQVQRFRAAGKPIPADLRYLAGLTRIDYVLFYPSSRDVVLAGPAEGWKQLPTGEVVGIKSGRPVVHLDDLIVALRYTFSRSPAAFVGCSIDPTSEGSQRYSQYMRGVRQLNAANARAVFAGAERAMGPQQIRVFGVEPSSAFALKMVAADYLLKRIAMGHDRSPVRGVPSYLDLAMKHFVRGSQPQHRWWFVADFDAVHHTADGHAYQIDGQGVQVATARQTPSTSGTKPPQATRSAKQFAATFTRQFPQMASQVPVFAELQNVVRLTVAAEIIAQKYFGRERSESIRYWQPSHFLDKRACEIAKFPVPQTVPSLASYRYARGKGWLISVSGGVEINPRTLVSKDRLKPTSQKALASTRETAQSPRVAKSWWWD